MNKFTEQELLAKLWTDNSRIGSIEAKKAIEFDNLKTVIERTSNSIRFVQTIEGLIKRQTKYDLTFTKNKVGIYELTELTLFGEKQNPPELTKEDMQGVLSAFTFDFNNSPSKSYNFTNKVEVKV